MLVILMNTRINKIAAAIKFYWLKVGRYRRAIGRIALILVKQPGNGVLKLQILVFVGPDSMLANQVATNDASNSIVRMEDRYKRKEAGRVPY